MIATQSCRRHGSRFQQPWYGWGHQGQHQLGVPEVHGQGGDLQVVSLQFSFKIRFNVDNFYAPLSPRGIEFTGPPWSPARIFINLANWSFVFVVPLLYLAIYKFRKAQAVTNLGI